MMIVVFKTSQDYQEELEQRAENDPQLAAAMEVNATAGFLKAISDRLLDGGNVCINMFGPPNHGKSNSLRKLARIIISFLCALGYNVSMESDVKFTRTYGESLVKFAERSKSPNWKTPVIVVQDEKLRMTGRNRIVATRNLMNNLDSFRVLIYCYLLCYCAYWKEVVKRRESFANMGFLIQEAIDHDWEDACQNRFMWWTREGPVGYVYIDFEEDNTVYDAWKIDGQRGTTSNLGAAASHMTDFDALAEQILSRLQRTPELAGADNLRLQDFKGLVRLMHESGEVTASDNDEDTAAWWAWRKHTSPDPALKKSPSLETQPEAQRILANSGEIEFEREPEKLPEGDYDALRQIALEELTKAVPGVKSSIYEEVREYDYPVDALTDERHWHAKDVKQQLNLPLRAESVGKNIKFYKKDAGNKAVEAIGARFVKWKLEHSNLPTQFTAKSGPGERDLSFTKNGRFIASANVKHFLDHVARTIHLAPEFQDPVHYAIVLRTKPFALRAYRGTGKEYLDAGAGGGSVWDLGWSGFIEDLRREVEKAEQNHE